ncbi:hypothetical protein ACU4GA_27055 [Methylobacterium oryzae CBMB20]
MSKTEASREPAAAYWMLQYKSAVEEKARVRVEFSSHERPAQIIATLPSKGECSGRAPPSPDLQPNKRAVMSNVVTLPTRPQKPRPDGAL